jgi:hypothetical protein
MADQLYLSCWTRGFTALNMLAQYEKLLRKFPFSRLAPKAVLRVYAFELSEPPALERDFSGVIEVDAIIAAAREYHHPDCAYLLETAWDIWQFEHEWRLRPAAVTAACYGPLFPSEMGEQFVIDFGLDSFFLPAQAASSAPFRHNIRGLLHFVEELASALPMEKRSLWSESGMNFAQQLETALGVLDRE